MHLIVWIERYLIFNLILHSALVRFYGQSLLSCNGIVVHLILWDCCNGNKFSLGYILLCKPMCFLCFCFFKIIYRFSWTVSIQKWMNELIDCLLIIMVQDAASMAYMSMVLQELSKRALKWCRICTYDKSTIFSDTNTKCTDWANTYNKSKIRTGSKIRIECVTR